MAVNTHFAVSVSKQLIMPDVVTGKVLTSGPSAGALVCKSN